MVSLWPWSSQELRFDIVVLFRGHEDEVLDVCFDFTGQYIATASADGKICGLVSFIKIMLVLNNFNS